MKTAPLPDWLTALLADVAPAGQGVHTWLYRCARQLHSRFPAPEIVRLLADHVANCGRAVSRKEIEEAVTNSVRCAWQPRGPTAGAAAPAVRKWPEPDLAQIEALAQTAGLAELWECSPLRIEDNEPHTEQIIDALFPGDPLICAGKSQSEFATRPREQWRGQLSGLQFLVPSPMTAPTGTTQGGRVSAHTLANTGPRKFLVVECDFAEFARDGKTETRYAPMLRRLAQANGGDMAGAVADLCAAMLLHLAHYAPLVLCVHSGGKSLHGWFHCAGQPEAKLARFFRYAVTLGADPATWTKSQFVRMPDGTRDTGRPQAVFFFAPQRVTL
jgi:hypothetical protein